MLQKFISVTTSIHVHRRKNNSALNHARSRKISSAFEVVSVDSYGDEQHRPPIFFDGKNEKGKVVTNPTIGFGKSRIHYANGLFQDTFRIGICATSRGLSIYILGLEDKNFLREFLGSRLGKAKITGYAMSFKKMSDIDESVLRELLNYFLK
jgi:hypothetical protein